MKFSWVGLLMTTTALGAGTAALAQQKTMYVAGYGGSYEQTMRKDVIPLFEKQANVKIEYVAGNSTDTLAKLQAGQTVLVHGAAGGVGSVAVQVAKALGATVAGTGVGGQPGPAA